MNKKSLFGEEVLPEHIGDPPHSTLEQSWDLAIKMPSPTMPATVHPPVSIQLLQRWMSWRCLIHFLFMTVSGHGTHAS